MYFEINRKPSQSVNTVFIFPCSSALKSKTSFLSPVLNFHGNETSTAWKKGETTYQKKKFGYLQYYSFHCSTRCSSSQHIHHPCLKSIRFLYFSQDHLQSTIGIICGMYSSLTVVALISSTFDSFHGRLISENKVACIKREWACISSGTRNFGPPLFCLFCFIWSNSSLYVVSNSLPFLC